MVAHITGSPSCRLVWETTLHGLTLRKWFQSYGRLMAAMVYATRFRCCTSPPTTFLRKEVFEKEYGQFTFTIVPGMEALTPRVLGLEAQGISTCTDKESWGDAYGIWPVAGDGSQQGGTGAFKVLLFVERGDVEPFGLPEALLTGKLCWVEIDLDLPEQFFAVEFEHLCG